MADLNIEARIAAAIVGDKAGAKRSAEEIKDAVADTFTELLTELDAKLRASGATPAQIAQETAALQAQVQTAIAALSTKGGLESYVNPAGVPRSERGVTAAGQPLSVRGVQSRLRETERIVGSLSTGLTDVLERQIHNNPNLLTGARINDRQQQLRSSADVSMGIADDPSDAAQAMVAAMEAEAAVLRHLADDTLGLAYEYQQAKATIQTIHAQLNAGVLEMLASTGEYSSALARSAVAQQQINNKVMIEHLGVGSEYVRETARGKNLQAAINNAVLQQQLNSGYGVIQAQAKLLQQQINNQMNTQLVANTKYHAEVARGQVLQQLLNNKVLSQHLTAGTGYVDALAVGRTMQQQLNNKVLAAQLTNGLPEAQSVAAALQQRLNNETNQLLTTYLGYAASVAEGQRLQQVLNNNVLNEHLKFGSLYVAETARGKLLQQQVNNAVLMAQLGNGYAAEMARAKQLQAQLNVQTQTILAGSTAYAADLAEAKVLQQRINNEVLIAQLSNGYVQAQAEGKALQDQLNLAIQREIVQRGDVARIGAERAILDQQQKVQNRGALTDLRENDPLADARYRQDRISLANADRDDAREKLADDQYIKATAEATAAKKLLAAQSRLSLMTEGEYIAAVTIEAQASLQNAAMKKRAELAAIATPEGAVAVEKMAMDAQRMRVVEMYKDVVELREMTGLHGLQNEVTKAELQAAANGLNLQQTQNKLKAERIALEERAVAMGLMDPKQTATRQPGLGLAQGFRTTAKYGIASMALFGVARGMAGAVKEAVELDRILNQIGRQFESQFGSGAGQQFDTFKKTVFEISELTGEGADNVAKLGFQFQGAFGGNTARALQETKSAIMAVRVTGLELTETIDAFTAITQSFQDLENQAGGTGVTIQQFSDIALQLQENLGVLAKETISFSADLAPVAAQMGFTAEQLAVLGAVTQKFSGRSGASLAEAYGRVLPQIQESGVEIAQIFSVLGDNVVDNLNAAFARGDIEAAFTNIVRNFNRLGASQQNAVVDLLGGRREASSIIPVLQNGAEVVEEFGKAMNAEGKTMEYFTDLQDTLQQKVDRLGERFNLFVEKVFQSGLKDFFSDFVDVLTTAVDLMSQLASVFGRLGTLIGPLADPISKMLQIALLYAGGRGLIRGARHVRELGRGGAAAATTAPATTAPVVAPASRAAALRAGAVGAASTAKGFLATNWVGLGVTAGLAIYSGLESSVRSSAENARAKLEAGGITDDEISRVLGNIGVAGGRDYIEEQLKRGTDPEDIKRRLGNEVEERLGVVDTFYDQLPGRLSKKSEDRKARVDAAVDAVVQQFNDDFAESMSRYTGGTVEGRAETNQKIRELLDARMGSLGVSPRVTTEFLDAIEQSVSEINNLSLMLGEGEVDVNSSIDRVINQNRRSGANALSEGQLRLLEEARERLGGDATLIEAFFSRADDARLGRTLERLKTAVKEGNLPEVLADIRNNSNLTEDQIALLEEVAILIGRTSMEGVANALDKGSMAFEEAKAQYEAGLLSLDRFEKSRDEYIAILGSQAVGNPDAAKKHAEELKARREQIFEQVTTEAAALTEIGELAGDTDYGRIEKLYASALDNPELSIEQRADIVRDIIDMRRQKQEAFANTLADEAERDRVMAQSISLNPEEQAAILSEVAAASAELQRAMGAFAEGNAVMANQLISAVVETSIREGISLRAAAEQLLRNSIAMRQAIKRAQDVQDATAKYLKRMSSQWSDLVERDFMRRAQANANAGGAAGELQIELDAMVEPLLQIFDGLELPDVSSVVGSGDGGAAADDAKSKLDEAWNAFRELAEARLDYALALVEGDPMKEAEIAIQRAGVAAQFARSEAERISAAAEQIRAERQKQEAQFDIYEAWNNWWLAWVSEDPVEAAQVAKNLADIAFERARGEAEKLDAMAQQIEADRAMQQAIDEIANSQISLLEAFANAAGRTVEAAQLAAERVNQELEQAIARGAGEAELNDLRGQAAQAEAGLRDAFLSDRKEYYQYLADMGQITTGQLVSYLQSLLAIPDLTEAQIRDLNRQIASLRNEMSQDFQFNLPTNLGLPTLYEVRRFNQSSSDGMAGGYNDNRTITVNVSAQTNADPDQIANAVASAIGDPSRTGTVERRY